MIGGYAGQPVTLHVPDAAVFDDCDGGPFATYGIDGDPGARTEQDPGQSKSFGSWKWMAPSWSSMR